MNGPCLRLRYHLMAGLPSKMEETNHMVSNSFKYPLWPTLQGSAQSRSIAKGEKSLFE